MIPKKVHYIWLGSEIPLHVQQIIERNSSILTGYETKIWTEENMPALPPFAQNAYEEKKWAFVSDFIRFYILYHEGGIYLDTDVEVLKSFDNLLLNEFIAGWDKKEAYIHTFIVGAVPSHPFIHAILSVYKHLEAGIYPTSPEVLTKCYREYENKEELSILPSKYLCPHEEGERITSSTFEHAYTNHLWQESWRSYVPLRRFLRRIGAIKVYHCFLSAAKSVLSRKRS